MAHPATQPAGDYGITFHHYSRIRLYERTGETSVMLVYVTSFYFYQKKQNYAFAKITNNLFRYNEPFMNKGIKAPAYMFRMLI